MRHEVKVREFWQLTSVKGCCFRCISCLTAEYSCKSSNHLRRTKGRILQVRLEMIERLRPPAESHSFASGLFRIQVPINGVKPRDICLWGICCMRPSRCCRTFGRCQGSSTSLRIGISCVYWSITIWNKRLHLHWVSICVCPWYSWFWFDTQQLWPCSSCPWQHSRNSWNEYK